MTANMAELFALLRGPNRSSSSSTPPPGQGPTVDPTPCVPPTQIPENIDAPAPPTLHTSTAHPFTSPFSPPPAPTAVPLPPATFLSSEQAPSAPPLVSIPAPAAIYTVPPPMVFSAPSAPAPTHPQAAELPSYPPLQPHTNFPYQAPPPINTTCHEPGTPTHAAQQVILDPMRPTDHEEFVIHSFQDILSGSALDWFMSLKAEDIPTWADLSRKFIDQYQYCAETPPTLLELSMKEMAQGQRFEEYATKWRAQAAKHIPRISEAQQIQLGVYYSHLLAHTSSFSDLIEAGKKLNLKEKKLGRMEGPTGKGEEPSKKTPATTTSSSGRRGKEVSVNAVNPAHPAPQQYSVNVTTAPPVNQRCNLVPPPQGQQGGAAQPRPRRQYPSLPVPLSHIYQQIPDKIGTIALSPNFDPTI
ncbi:hypothetical protein CRG98_005827 [Punica granatum]|uniref:Retrotransposon gag domain-containing protein n=1 Tax=Punica granatum TaxID=22663 RepID=A0A2I0KZ94_PUNGR|nr:hypothetical protein CRG98_005827 [Punica granatum]